MRYLLFLLCLSGPIYGQSLGTAGTIRGKVTDPSGAVVAGATVSLSNDLTLYRREVKAVGFRRVSVHQYPSERLPPRSRCSPASSITIAI